MTKNIITDKVALKRLIQKSVTETLHGLIPEEATAPAPQAPVAAQGAAPAPQGGSNVSVSKVAAGTPGQTDQSIGNIQPGQISLEMVVEKLNSLRSGRSFKDDNVAAQMQQYFNDLNDNEKLALFAFAKGIAQIVTGEIPGAQAPNPAAVHQKIEMADQGNMQQVKHVKPNIVKKAPAATATPTSGAENTASPMPIAAKQR
jgi:hypothetical protein